MHGAGQGFLRPDNDESLLCPCDPGIDKIPLDKLMGKLKELKDKPVCKWPLYDRLLHNPVEDKITVDGDIILLEGNYLLLDTDGWNDLSSFADYTISLTADESLLRKRLIERRMSNTATQPAKYSKNRKRTSIYTLCKLDSQLTFRYNLSRKFLHSYFWEVKLWLVQCL